MLHFALIYPIRGNFKLSLIQDGVEDLDKLIVRNLIVHIDVKPDHNLSNETIECLLRIIESGEILM